MLKRAVVTEELFTLTGDQLSATILHQFLYWSVRTRDTDHYLAEEKQRLEAHGQVADLPFTGGWIYKRAEDLGDEIMCTKSAQTIRKRVTELVKKGWLAERRNPKYKYDRTLQYRVDWVRIETDLRALGYSLATIRVCARYFDDLFGGCNLQNGGSTLDFGASSLENGGTIPEITTKTTAEIGAPDGAHPNLQNSDRDVLLEFFQQRSGCVWPEDVLVEGETPSEQKRRQKRLWQERHTTWLTPLKRMLQLANDLSVAKEVLGKAYDKLHSDQMTVSSPLSCLKTYQSILAARRKAGRTDGVIEELARQTTEIALEGY